MGLASALHLSLSATNPALHATNGRGGKEEEGGFCQSPYPHPFSHEIREAVKRVDSSQNGSTCHLGQAIAMCIDGSLGVWAWPPKAQAWWVRFQYIPLALRGWCNPVPVSYSASGFALSMGPVSTTPPKGWKLPRLKQTFHSLAEMKISREKLDWRKQTNTCLAAVRASGVK